MEYIVMSASRDPRFAAWARPAGRKDRWSLFSSRSSRFGADERGGVAILFAFVIFALCLFVGIAVDYGMALRAKADMQGASDAAVLAAASHLQGAPRDMETAEAKARAIYLANREARRVVVGGEDVRFELTRESDGALRAEAFAEGKVKTHFSKIMHLNELPVATYAAAKIERMNVELAMVVDITTSMIVPDSSKLRALKDAAKELIQEVIWEDQSVWQSRIALIPYSHAVNISNLPGPIATVAPRPAHSSDWKLQNGCVSERTDGDRYGDSVAAVGRVYGSSASCAIPPANALSNDVDSLTRKIDDLAANGTTAIHIGAAWGYYALSPNWASRFGHSVNPYNDRDTAKYLVIMTDGDNTVQYCGGGLPDRNSRMERKRGTCTGTNADTQLRAICENAKGKGIEVITVGFQVSNAARNLLTQCASPDSYYNAASNAALVQAFKEIAARVNKLHLSH